MNNKKVPLWLTDYAKMHSIKIDDKQGITEPWYLLNSTRSEVNEIKG